MLNYFDKYIVYLDSDTLSYMYLSYSKKRNYPVMNKLYSVLHEGFTNNILVTPLSMDHLFPYIKENQIDINILNMMGGLGQTQFLQKFTITTLQLIRIINHFFNQDYKKPVWKDAFSSDPDEKNFPGFNKYSSIAAMNVQTAIEREKKNSQIYEFLEGFKEGKTIDSISSRHFKLLWEKFQDIIIPYLPVDGLPESNIKQFLEYEEIKEIPEFHIISNIIYPLLESYDFEDIEHGLKDELLLAVETIASYLPYCNFYVTKVDIAELVNMAEINEPYNVRVYDHNESSLYKLIQDLSDLSKVTKERKLKEMRKTKFRRTGSNFNV